MNLKGNQLKPNSKLGSGRVRCYVLPYGNTRITQITTYCSNIMGPGPTHIYLIENDELILMDTGMPTSLTKSIFRWSGESIPTEIANLPSDYSERQLFEGLKLAGHSIKDIDWLVISHGHLDHFSLGPSLLRHAKPRVVAHLFDTPEICNPWGMPRLWLSRRQQMLGTGMPMPQASNRSMIRAASQKEFDFSLQVDSPVFQEGHSQTNGFQVKGVQVKHLPGHSAGSIGLIVGDEGEEKILLCGDVLLDPITPHPDDLLLYLRTLEDLKRLENIALVLPAHGKIIRDLRVRVTFLKEHHRRRLKLTYDACKKPRCVWDIATMRGYFDIHVDTASFNPIASMEVLAHIDILKMTEGLFRFHMEEGICYYQNSGEPFDDVYDRVMRLVRDRSEVVLL